MTMRKWALLCAALLLLTACSAAPRFDLAAGEIAVLYVLGVPLYLFMKKENVIGKILK